MPSGGTTRPTGNADWATIAGFGEEWESFDQSALSEAEWRELFERYFGIFPWDSLPASAEGFDLGCGSGRWALGVAGRVGTLHCIDPSKKALGVARRRLAGCANASFHHAPADAIPLPDASQDFGYTLGVLHHIPDTAAALRACTAKLKPGAPFLLYIYYAFDNRPAWFRALWHAADLVRRVVCRLPFVLRKAVSGLIAALAYWPLARLSRLLEAIGLGVGNFPLSAYRKSSFYSMRTDALDRFGTRLEQRFTRAQVAAMMEAAGLEAIRFSETVPYWVAIGRRSQRSGG
jgi:SAM-dependent methyltransferase